MYINKVFNVGNAWERVQTESAEELSELQMALQNLGYVESTKEFKDNILSSLNDSGWKCRTMMGGYARFRQFNPSSVKSSMTSMAAMKGNLAVDLGMSMPTNLDSWVTYRAKSTSSLGIVPILVMPLTIDDDSVFRMSFDYAIQRIQYLDIFEDNSFLILGCSYDESYLEVVNLDTVIRRTITFEPHQIQAGMSLLSYFSEILKQKCSESNSKVSIEQDGDKVRLRIKSNFGTEQKVEALLNEYGEVLNGTKQPAQFMTDQIQLLSLQSKLDMAAMEVKHQQNILALTKSNYDQRIVSLEDQVSSLKLMLSNSISTHRLAQEQVSNLIDKYGAQGSMELELLAFAKKLDERAADVHKDELERILKQLHSQNPKLASEFLSLLKGPLEGVIGNIMYSWLPQLSSIVGLVIR
ncbi:hypothetical protein ABMX79_13600 [Vibrio vulnificus]|uniref:hypothetical protein n=1 Tax=Vibrio vulnificus TaxID=672 RepID=UPI00405853A9